MKVLIHSNGPHVYSGYGKQAKLSGRILRALGHEVAFSCFTGLHGQRIEWNGYNLLPGGMLAFGVDVVAPHALFYGADLVMPIMDFYKLEPAARQLGQLRLEHGIRTAAFVITDCRAENGGPSLADQRAIAASGAYPVAVSEFGLNNLRNLGYDPDGGDFACSYVPHSIDPYAFRPHHDREALREESGNRDKFVIGIMAANKDLIRKAFVEQMAAFQRFSKRHDDAVLSLFTIADGPGGINLQEVAHDFGIIDKVIFMPSYEQACGLLPDDFMTAWYNNLNVLSLCSYGEGFGVPLIEAQACGTPVVATRWSATEELAREAGWLVDGERFWNPQHRGWWMRPYEDSILEAWEAAYQEGPSEDRRKKARDFATGYSWEAVERRYWKPFMERMEALTTKTDAEKVQFEKLNEKVDLDPAKFAAVTTHTGEASELD